MQPMAGVLRPGMLYVLRDGKPVGIHVRTGISDGAFTEVQGDGLAAGGLVVLGLDVSAAPNRAGLAPPPGMGGPMGRPGGRR
jgi:HlyD family secretion protein